MPLVRAFIAVSFPAPAAADLARGVEPLAVACRRAGLSVAWVPARNMHLTLHFLGSVLDLDLLHVTPALREALADMTPPCVGLQSIGVLPSPSRPRVLYAAVDEPAGLIELHRRVEAALEPLGHRPEGKPFLPHVTVGRVRSARGGADVAALLAPYAGRRFGAPAPLAEVQVFESRLGAGPPEYVLWSKVPVGGDGGGA